MADCVFTASERQSLLESQSQILSYISTMSSRLSSIETNVDDLSNYFEVTEGDSFQENMMLRFSHLHIIFRSLLILFYNSLCYVSNLSRNFVFSLEKTATDVQTSAVPVKFHFKVNWTYENVLRVFLQNDYSYLLSYSISAGTASDNFCGGRVLTDTTGVNEDNVFFAEFCYEFEVFSPAIDLVEVFKIVSVGFSTQEKTDLFTLVLKNFYKTGLNTSILSGITDRVLSKDWLNGILSKSTPTNEDWRLLDASASSLPSVIDLGLDGVDTAIDTFDAVSNQITSWRSKVEEFKNTLIHLSEQNKLDLIVAGLYCPEILNRNLGNAINFPRNLSVLEVDKQYIVKKIDSPTQFVSFWEFLADIVDDAILNDSLRWNWDFAKFCEFLDDTGENKLWLSDELKYCNAKNPRWSV